MKKIVYKNTFFLVLVSFLFSCSQLTSPVNRYIASDELSSKLRDQVEKIDGTELLDEGAKQLLYDEQVLHNKRLWGSRGFATPMDKKYWPENRGKFKLPYFLIPESDSDVLLSEKLGNKTASYITEVIDGEKYFKLFVHPVSYKHYKFLNGKYKFIDSDKTEFTAAPTSSYRSLLVWSHRSKIKPFIAKVTLDTTIIGSISRVVKRREVLRSLANQRAFDSIGRERLREIGVDYYDESAGLNIAKNHKDQPKVLGGQIIREVPEKVSNGEYRWVSLSTVMSPESEGPPLIMDMIEKSNLDSIEFFEKIFIDSYMKMFEEFSFIRGFNFEPHSQNLSMELKDGKATGKWVHRDFGGFWPDILKVIESGGPVEALMNQGHAEDFYFRGARSNFATSYAFFYKRQVFDYVLAEIRKYDKSITDRDVFNLNDKINNRMVSLMKKHLNYSGTRVPTMMNYSAIGKELMRNITFKQTADMTLISDVSSARKYQALKIANGEWVEYYEKTPNSPAEYYIGDNGIYRVRNGHVEGFGLFNHKEKSISLEDNFTFNTLMNRFSELLRNSGLYIEPKPFKKSCLEVIRGFFK